MNIKYQRYNISLFFFSRNIIFQNKKIISRVSIMDNRLDELFIIILKVL